MKLRGYILRDSVGEIFFRVYSNDVNEFKDYFIMADDLCVTIHDSSLKIKPSRDDSFDGIIDYVDSVLGIK